MDAAISNSVPLERDSEGWLTEATCEGLRATLPKCPECDGDIYLVRYMAFETHKFYADLDNTGSFSASSQHYDTLDAVPEEDQHVPSRGIGVECENGHDWFEPRLRLYRQEGDYARWEILP